MFNKLINYIKGHKKPFGVGFIVALFLVAGLVLGQTAFFQNITAELTGDITRRKPAIPSSITVVSPQAGETYAVGDDMTISV